MNLHSWALGALAGLGLLIGAFFFGRSTGIDHQKAIYAKATEKAVAAMERGRQAIDLQSARYADLRRDQQAETRTIWHEATRIIERPVFHTVCIDADAVRLLDRARANANRSLASTPSDDPARTAPGSAQ